MNIAQVIHVERSVTPVIIAIFHRILRVFFKNTGNTLLFQILQRPVRYLWTNGRNTVRLRKTHRLTFQEQRAVLLPILPAGKHRPKFIRKLFNTLFSSYGRKDRDMSKKFSFAGTGNMIVIPGNDEHQSGTKA